MNERDLDEISRFLASVGKSSLFEYLGAATDAPNDEMEKAIRTRRSWAQGQQSNPKYKREALWVIKNIARIKRALLEDRAAYVKALDGADQGRKLQVLKLFIMGTLAEGLMTAKGEEAIREQARTLGLDSAAVDAQIKKMLVEHKARREGDAPEGGGPEGGRAAFVDHYAVLDVYPDADINTLEKAYRDRYHWARQLKDPRKSEDIYRRLDDAWNVLNKPGSRARYDERRREVLGDPLPGARTEPAAADSSSPKPPERELGSAPSLSKRLRLGGSGDDEDSVSIRRPALGGAPRTPPALQAGQTLGIAGGNRATRPARSARLEVEGPDTLSVKVGRRGANATLTVRRAGSGSMPGRVFVDRDWVTVEPARLDPDAESQVVQVHVDREGMARAKAVAMVTVVTDDGQRRSVTLEAERKSILPLVALAAAAIVGVGGGTIATQIDFSDPPPEGPVSGTLVVIVDPPAGQIFVDNELVSTEGSAKVSEGLFGGEESRVRVEQDGFAAWSSEVMVPPGERTELRVELELTDKMNWRPALEDVQVDLDERAARASIHQRKAVFDRCFRDNVEGDPGVLTLLDISATVNARGRIVGLDFDKENFESTPPLQDCLKRQLRAIKLPLIKGDYAVFRHQFRYTIAEPSRKK
jgi:hypothetical protein